MLVKSIRDRFLVDELQLEQQINEALHSDDRSSFALLLSLLSSDVLDNPNFIDQTFHPPDEVDWRKRMELPPPVALDATKSDSIATASRSELLHEGGIMSVHFYNAVVPDPLSWRQFAIPADVWDELSPLQQEKLKVSQAAEHTGYDETPDQMISVLETFDYSQELKVNYYFR